MQVTKCDAAFVSMRCLAAVNTAHLTAALFIPPFVGGAIPKGDPHGYDSRCIATVN